MAVKSKRLHKHLLPVVLVSGGIFGIISISLYAHQVAAPVHKNTAIEHALGARIGGSHNLQINVDGAGQTSERYLVAPPR